MKKKSGWFFACLQAWVTVACATSVFAAPDVVMSPQGEVASLQQALQKVRQLRASGKLAPNQIADVEVLPGYYSMSEAANFAAEDSYIAFRAKKDGTVFFDGGVVAPRFVAGADGVWRAKVSPGFTFEQLYVNGKRAQRARTPNQFYLYCKEPWDAGVDPRTNKPTDLSRRAFVANKEDISDLVTLAEDDLKRVEIIFWQSWDQGRCKVDYVDGKNDVVITQTGTGYPLFYWSSTCPRYALENYRAALDAPGEWFYDVKAGELLYIPREGETVENTVAVMPRAREFIRLNGSKFVSFEGLTFQYGSWVMGPDGGVNHQSAQNIRTAAIFGDGVRNLRMHNCTIRHVGAHAVWLKRGCRNCVIEHNRIEDMGAGGVYLGDTADWHGEKLEERSGFNVVRDNIIRHGGYTFNGAIGVWIAHASDNEISHNDIGDFFYTGVSMGWCWGYGETMCHRNHLFWNRIHHIGKGVLSDMGGVYTLGNSKGTVEMGNWIHDVNGYAGAGSPAWGLYTDEGSQGIVLCSNLVERCRDGAVHQHYGRNNTWVNNLLVTFDQNGVWRSRVEKHTTIIITNNVFWWTNPKAHVLSGGIKTTVDDVVFDGNLYWGTQGVASDAFSGRDFATWQQLGHDKLSKFEDPQFVNPEKGDWRLAATSPALKMGFKPWDWTEAGVFKADAAWRAEAMNDEDIPPLCDAPKAPRYFRTHGCQDFERYGVGSHSNYGVLHADGAQGMRVVQGGYHSDKALRLEKKPNLGASWRPHLIANVHAQEGKVYVAFAFKMLDNIAKAQMECRDYNLPNGAPYAGGPSITFDGGNVCALGRLVTNVPLNTWCKVEVVFYLTGDKHHSFDCTVTPDGGKSVTMTGIKYSNLFNELDWVGFMTYGAESGSWMLDDFCEKQLK